MTAVLEKPSRVTTVSRGEAPSKVAYEAPVAGLGDGSSLLSKPGTSDPTQRWRWADAWDHGTAHHTVSGG